MRKLLALALTLIAPYSVMAKSPVAQHRIECQSGDAKIIVVLQKSVLDGSISATLTNAGTAVSSDGVTMQNMPMQYYLKYSGEHVIESEARVEGYDTALWDISFAGSGDRPRLNLHTSDLFKRVSNNHGYDGADPYVVELNCSGAVDQLF